MAIGQCLKQLGKVIYDIVVISADQRQNRTITADLEENNTCYQQVLLVEIHYTSVSHINISRIKLAHKFEINVVTSFCMEQYLNYIFV